MIKINIPSFKKLEINNIVFDYNGTLAIDGMPVRNSIRYLKELNKNLNVYVLTADTFGTARRYLPDEINVKIIEESDQEFEKKRFIESLCTEETIAVGNGYNDILMLETAVLGVLLIQAEGASTKCITKADLVYTDIIDFMKSLVNKKRLIASLRR